jgi:ATP-dependent exoDNAse (exonuclease V) beta subunit
VREGELQQMLLRRTAKRRSPIAAPEPPTVEAPQALFGKKQEENCLALLLRYPELREDGLGLSPELFWHIENRQVLEAWQGCRDMDEVAQAVPEELEGHLQRLNEAFLPPLQEAKAKLREFVGFLKKRETEALTQASNAALAALEAERMLTEEELAAAVEALQTGTIPVGAGVDASRVSAILENTEMGLRLHQDSKMEPDEEDERYVDAEKVENG